MNKIPLLIDLDGVLRIDKSPANGSDNFLNYLKKNNVPSCILSNSTLYGSKEIKEFFDNNNINHHIPIITAVEAAADYIKDKYETVSVFVNDRVKYLFEGIPDSSNPDAVVIGDLGKTWNFEIINNIFKKLLTGADLIALQKNKYWKTSEDGILIDAGAFVAGLEFSADKEAILIGKPSPLYFQSGLKATGCSDCESFIMIGDDLTTDIKGAKAFNAKTILILTGKTSEKDLEKSETQPDYIAQNLEEVIEILNTII